MDPQSDPFPDIMNPHPFMLNIPNISQWEFLILGGGEVFKMRKRESIVLSTLHKSRALLE